MTPIRVVGIGSPFGDDRAGWLVAERLASAARSGRFEVRILDRPGPAVLDAIAGCEIAILVDAVAGGAEVGAIHRLDAAALQEGMTGAASAHAFGVADALRLGEALKCLPRRLLVYGIEIGPAGPCDGTSPQVSEAAARLAAEILAVIDAEGPASW